MTAATWSAERGSKLTDNFAPFLWHPDWTSLIPLGDPASNKTQAWAINIHGVISGEYLMAGELDTACLFELNKPPVPLGPGFAFCINDSGLVAGQSDRQAVVWDNKVMQNLTTVEYYSAASKVNNSGVVIGNSTG